MANGNTTDVALIRMMTDVLVSKESHNQRSSQEAVGISGGGAEFQIFGFVKRVWLLVVCTVQIWLLGKSDKKNIVGKTKLTLKGTQQMWSKLICSNETKTVKHNCGSIMLWRNAFLQKMERSWSYTSSLHLKHFLD